MRRRATLSRADKDDGVTITLEWDEDGKTSPFVYQVGGDFELLAGVFKIALSEEVTVRTLFGDVG